MKLLSLANVFQTSDLNVALVDDERRPAGTEFHSRAIRLYATFLPYFIAQRGRTVAPVALARVTQADTGLEGIVKIWIGWK